MCMNIYIYIYIYIYISISIHTHAFVQDIPYKCIKPPMRTLTRTLTRTLHKVDPQKKRSDNDKCTGNSCSRQALDGRFHMLPLFPPIRHAC